MSHEFSPTTTHRINGYKALDIIRGNQMDLAEKMDLAFNRDIEYPITKIESLPPYRATPLDPLNLYVGGLSTNLGRYFQEYQSYQNYALSMTGKLAYDTASMYGNNMEAAFLMQRELDEQIRNRCTHNTEAFLRLGQAVRGTSGVREIDNQLLELILRARSGMAELPELLRIIKEFPDMISVETSNAHALLTLPEATRYRDAARAHTMELKHNFNDARVTLNDDEVAESQSFSKNVPDTRVTKYVLATIESETSSTQHVLKIAQLSTSVGRFYIPRTYFRATDYRSRPGYGHESIDDEPEVTSVIPIDVGDDEIAPQIANPEHRQWYLAALAGAAERIAQVTTD